MSTYSIIRHYQDANRESEVVDTGLTLKDAQAHCKSPETSSRTAKGREARRRTEECGPWFDGYTEE